MLLLETQEKRQPLIHPSTSVSKTLSAETAHLQRMVRGPQCLKPISDHPTNAGRIRSRCDMSTGGQSAISAIVACSFRFLQTARRLLYTSHENELVRYAYPDENSL